MTHQEIQNNEIIEQYVLDKLSAADRQAFQEHYFECAECFEQAELTARFVAGVREASRSGILAADRSERPGVPGGWWSAVFIQRWAMPALAACLLLAVTLTGLWALSLKRQNQLLARQMGEENRLLERLQSAEAKIGELEGSGSTSQAEKESLKQEIIRLKEQLANTQRQRDTHVAQVQQPEVNVPVRNIYPVDNVVRSGGTVEINQLRLPRGSRTFVLILGEYQPGYSNYRLEVRGPSGQLVANRAGLKPDQNGELSVLLNRTQLSRGKYRLKLYGGGKPAGEYFVQVE